MTIMEGRSGGLTTRQTGEAGMGARMTGEAILLSDNLTGKWFERAYRGNVYFASAAAVTVPVNAATLVSVFGFYNPAGSGKIMEVIDVDIMNVLATTVVDAFGVYASTVAESAAATFTTAGTIRNRRVSDSTSGVVRFYSAVTHSGTPTLQAIVGGHGATTNASGGNIHKRFDGSLLIPPGVLFSIAASTAAGTSSGLTLGLSWAEVPS